MIHKFKGAIPLTKWGVNALAWDRENALNFIQSISKENIGIIGGDVYLYDSGKIKPLVDSWCWNKKINETSSEYNLRSKNESYEYISNYPPKANILFYLILTDNIDVNAILDTEPSYQLEIAKIIDKGWIMCPYCLEAWESDSKDQFIWCAKCRKKSVNTNFLAQ
jgi:hypothetical protein